MWPAAAGIALMSFTETIAAARAFGASGEPRPDPNQELLALGAANAAGGLLGAMPGGRRHVADRGQPPGRRAVQVAALVTATTALATLLLLGPVIALMPQAALAAVVVFYSLELIKPAEFAAIRRVRRTEFLWAVTAFAGVVLLGTLQGHPGGRRRLAAVAGPAGLQSARLCRSAASAARLCSAPARRSTPTMRRGRAC